MLRLGEDDTEAHAKARDEVIDRLLTSRRRFVS
jgi:hypothetical protein